MSQTLIQKEKLSQEGVAVAVEEIIRKWDEAKAVLKHSFDNWGPGEVKHHPDTRIQQSILSLATDLNPCLISPISQNETEAHNIHRESS